MKLSIYTDGGARGNPGPAAIAVLICDEEGRAVKTHAEYIGETTNNVAEYRAVLRALKLARQMKAERVVCTLDSELVASQLGGKYKIKKPHLRELSDLVKEEEKGFSSVEYRHVRRGDEHIPLVDSLLNRVLDRMGAGRR